VAAVHASWQAMRDAVLPRLQELIETAEAKSDITCELCGAPGTLCDRRHWYKILCDDCATAGGWSTIPADDED
jgi:putative intracellular protease/amidase